jgi:hypothetical protein
MRTHPHSATPYSTLAVIQIKTAAARVNSESIQHIIDICNPTALTSRRATTAHSQSGTKANTRAYWARLHIER